MTHDDLSDHHAFLEEAARSSLAARIESVADAWPHRVAISHQGRLRTYDQVNRRANQIADRINRIACLPAPIALAGGTTPEMIEAIVAAFKLGRPFVFLGAQVPDLRAEYILNETGCACIVCESESFQRELFTRLDLPCVLLSDPLADCRDSNHGFPVGPESLAYIVYTSGSTGLPKGVPQSHAAVMADILRQGIDLRVTSDDVYGLLFSPGGSAAICHICGAFLHGARLSPFDIRQHSLHELRVWLEIERVSILDINVATFRQLCRSLADERDCFPDLRILAPGSEPVHRHDVELFNRHFSPRCLFQNAFGTSETRTVTQCFIRHGAKYEHEGEHVSIGFPVTGKDVLLLDETGAPVDADAGAVGELVVRSRFIAHGYWRNDGLTAERFSVDPSDPALMRYATNDLARRLPSGAYVHLGRKDFSIKIHGVLVAFAEVEAAVRSHPAVADAVVIGIKNQAGENALACFCIVEPGRHVLLREIRAHLAARLAPQMVPSTFRFPKEFPCLPNGKLDRLKLAQSVGRGAGRSLTPDEVPRPGLEQDLAAAFASVLGVATIGRNDDFFEMGGDSLLTLSLSITVEETLGWRLSIAEVARCPTVASLATSFEQKRGRTEWIPLSRTRSAPRIFVVPGSVGTGLEFAHLAAKWEGRFRLDALQHGGTDGQTLPDRTVEDAAKRFSRVIAEESPVGPAVLMGFSFGALVAYETARLLALNGRSVHVILLDHPNYKAVGRAFDPQIGDIGLFQRVRLIRAEIRQLGGFARIGYFVSYFASRVRNGYHRVFVFTRRFRNIEETAHLKAGDWVDLVFWWQRHAAERYHPRPTTARVSFIRASGGMKVHAEETASGYGWKSLATNGFSLHHVACGHYMLIPANLSMLLPALEAALSRNETPESGA